MSKTFLKIGFGLLVAALTGPVGAAAAGGFKSLAGHMPAAVAKLTPVGRMAATNQLRLAIGLPLRNTTELTNLLEQVSDPASSNYRHYLTPEEFTAQFGPTEQDYQAIKDFAQANGLKVVGEHPNRLLLDVSGSVVNVENAFQVKMHNYNHPTEARTFYAPDSEPVVDAALPLLHVSGMNNFTTPRNLSQIKPLKSGATVGSFAGSGPQGTYMGSDFRKAYMPGAPQTGTGQNIGLFQLDGFFPQDPAAYARQIGLTNPPNLIVVPVDGGVSFPGGANGEVCLDIEMIMSMAPGVSNIYVYEADYNLVGNPQVAADDVLSKMANDNSARQLSISWFWLVGQTDPTADQIFQQMALQGQTVFAASGDSDAWHDPDSPESYPQDSPYITVVGGTTLTTAADGSFASETVWNWGIPNQNGGDWGSSGGVSDFYPIPAWQKGINMTANHGSISSRNMPDVALTADNIYVISDNGQVGSSGGTSAASPLWAAVMSLVNQQAALNGQAPVGFINPIIYTLAKSANYNTDFRDVTIGNNFWPSSPTNYPAVAGYDLSAGLGSPNGTNFINALASATGTNILITIPVSAPLPPWGTNLTVLNGSNPNGPWFLFVQDDAQFDSGVISNGWLLNLTTANPVGSAADLEITMSTTNNNVKAGNNLTYIIGVTNYGPSACSNAVVTDTLPDSATFLSASPTNSVTRHGTQLVWNVGELDATNGAQLTLTLQSQNVSASYTNSASVASPVTLDPNSYNNDAAATISAAAAVLTPPQLSGVGVGGKFQLSVTNVTGRSVIIQASTNLINWASIYTNANTTPFTFTNTSTTGYPYRFYRALFVP